MIRTIVTVLSFTVWNIMDLFSTKLIFDRFYVLGESKKRDYRYIWILYSFAVTYVYCLMKLHRPGIACNIFFFLFYLRMVPLVWSAYGGRVKIPAIVFFYEEAEAVVSSTLTIVVITSISGESMGLSAWIDDMFASLIAVVFFVILRALLYMKHKGTQLWMADLSVWEYILLIAAIFFTGNVETAVWRGDNSVQDRAFVTILMALVLVMALRLIFVNNKNFSMENLLETLRRQMRDMTEYYKELNAKDTEMRKFRHDTKNHMLAVSSMIEDGKSDQALEYMHKLYDTVYVNRDRMYQTGNYLVDSLLFSKAHTAEKTDTLIEFEGRIPTDNVDDVDIVIIFSNIIDNALDACKKIKGKKKIHVNSVYENSTWALEVINPVIGHVNIAGNHIDTSKGNTQLHGFGLSNIEDAVEKFHGSMTLSSTENEFSIRVILPIG